jgi:hypothetical protein
MNPSVWGPPAWKFLEIVVLNYPSNPNTNDKIHYKIFLESLKDILPCDQCKKHYNENLIKYPLNEQTLSCQYNLINWLLNIHNNVNKMNGKKIMTYSEFINKHNKNININKKNYTNYTNYIIYLIGLSVLIIMIYIIYNTTKINN